MSMTERKVKITMNDLLNVERIVVVNQKTGEEIAVITNDLITTASDEIVVKIKP